MDKLVTLENNKLADNLENKLGILGKETDVYEIVKQLNNIYKGELTFELDDDYQFENVIVITKINKDISIINLPEVKALNFDNVFGYSGSTLLKNIVTVKLPKCCKKLSSKAFWIRHINRLFVWDTTDISELSNINLSLCDLKMIIVQHTKDDKADIIRI